MVRPASPITTLLALSLPIASVLAQPSAGASPSAKGQVAKAPITIRIELRHTRVVAGPPIEGTAVLTNSTSKNITVQTCATNGWLSVGLSNKTIPSNGPGFFEVACPPSVVLKPGANRYPVTVPTTYGSCSQPGLQTTTTFTPLCGSRGKTMTGPASPPLPAGKYTTKIVTQGLSGLTAISRPVEVTLIRSTSP
jgi:hypothetical protein